MYDSSKVRKMKRWKQKRLANHCGGREQAVSNNHSDEIYRISTIKTEWFT